MKSFTLIVLSIMSLCVGFMYYALQKKLIIIQFPSYAAKDVANGGSVASKKNIKIYYWSQGALKHEQTPVIDSENKADMVRHIVINWLTICQQSGSMAKKVGLETVMLSGSSSEVYISFEYTIFSSNESTFEKWMVVESLLKTLYAANLSISRVYFFVHHQPLVDAHLDFSKSWPINGFLEH